MARGMDRESTVQSRVASAAISPQQICLVLLPERDKSVRDEAMHPYTCYRLGNADGFPCSTGVLMQYKRGCQLTGRRAMSLLFGVG